MRCPDCNLGIQLSSLETEIVADGLEHLKGACRCGEIVHFLCDGSNVYAWTSRKERALARTLLPLAYARAVLLVPPDVADFDEAVRRFLLLCGNRSGMVVDEKFREKAEPYSRLYPVVLWGHSVFATTYLAEKVMAERLSGRLYSASGHVLEKFQGIYE